MFKTGGGQYPLEAILKLLVLLEAIFESFSVIKSYFGNSECGNYSMCINLSFSQLHFGEHLILCCVG